MRLRSLNQARATRWMSSRVTLNGLEMAEEVAPVASQHLIAGELVGQPAIGAELLHQLGAGAALDPCQFLFGDQLRLQALDLGQHGLFVFLVGMSGGSDGEKQEEVGVLVAGKAGKAGGHSGNLFLLHQAAVEARGATPGKNVLHRVEDGGVGVADAGLVVADSRKGWDWA